jgi:hypothetical protein
MKMKMIVKIHLNCTIAEGRKILKISMLQKMYWN